MEVWRGEVRERGLCVCVCEGRGVWERGVTRLEVRGVEGGSVEGEGGGGGGKVWEGGVKGKCRSVGEGWGVECRTFKYYTNISS